MTVLGYNQQTLGCGKCSNTNNPVLQQINYKGEKREDEKTKDQKILKKYCILNNHILWIFFESWFKWKTVKKKNDIHETIENLKADRISDAVKALF